MSFNNLPDDIIDRIFHCLLNDMTSFINLASTCKRCCLIANQLTIHSEAWAQNRPIVFDFYLEPLEVYLPSLCARHGTCAERHYRTGTKCELQLPPNQRPPSPNISPTYPPGNLSIPSTSSFERSLTGGHATTAAFSEAILGNSVDEPTSLADKEECYYHRLFCLLNSKYRTFSTIRFKDARLSDRGCIKPFQDSLKYKLPNTNVEQNIKALVALELYSCDITLDWLNTILNQLDHISYLTLNEISFIDPSILVEQKHLASKKLEQLRITGDRTCRINDSIFMYFLENFPAVEFDLTGTRVEYHKRIIQRFYTNANISDLYSIRPSEYVLTFPMVLFYLRKYQAVVKRFIANETDITFTCLKRLLQDEDLKHLEITIRNCPMITEFERTRLADQVEASDIARVIF